MSVLRNDIQIGDVSHGRPAVGTVPGMVHLTHVGDEFLHLTCAKSSSDHHLNTRHKGFKFYWVWVRIATLQANFSLQQSWTRPQLKTFLGKSFPDNTAF